MEQKIGSGMPSDSRRQLYLQCESKIKININSKQFGTGNIVYSVREAFLILLPF